MSVLSGSKVGNKEVDLIDVMALVLLPIASSLMFGIFSWQIQVFGGFDFTQSLWTLAGTAITPALLIVVFSVGWIVATNFANGSTTMDDTEKGVVVTALLLPILYVFVPAVADLVTWHDMMRLAAVLYVSIASVYISYVG